MNSSKKPPRTLFGFFVAICWIVVCVCVNLGNKWEDFKTRVLESVPPFAAAGLSEPITRTESAFNNSYAKIVDINSSDTPTNVTRGGKKDHSKSSQEVSRLSKINVFLESYVDQMTEMRNRALNDNHTDWPPMAVQRQQVRANDRKFFNKLSEFDNLLIKASYEDLSFLLNSEYYNYSSNNCTQTRTSGPLHLSCKDKVSQTMNASDISAKWPSLFDNLPGRYDQEDDKTQLLTYLTVVRKGILTHDGDVVTGEKRIIPERCITKDQLDQKHYKFLDVDAIKYYPEIFAAHQRFGGQIYHGTIEVLQRIVPYLSFLNRNPTIKIQLVYKNPIVQLLGIDPKRVITKTQARADIVYMPQGGGCCKSPFFTLQLLSLHLKRNLMQTSQDTIVLLKRSQKTKGRYFQAHQAIEEMTREVAARFGLRAVVFSDHPLPTFDEQVSMFSRALVIIGPHGAGLCNAVLSRPGTLIIEGAHTKTRRGYSKGCFLNLAEVLGLRFFGIHLKDMTKTPVTRVREPLLDYLSAWKASQNHNLT